jgi:hypothetical protein
VASGKLYERFLSIMIASVMKHTESTVKFWFIENFLSPEFKVRLEVFFLKKRRVLFSYLWHLGLCSLFGQGI